MAKDDEQELLTLTEVSNRTDISMPTLGKYKKNHQDRIPSVGEGRTQRYPVEALEVFQKIKEENLSRRGRPSKTDDSDGSGAKSSRAEDGKNLLSLKAISRRVDISYQTLLRYVDQHLDRIPHSGSGRTKKYPAKAIEVFRKLYEESTGSKPARTKPGKGRKKTKATKGSAATGASDDLGSIVEAIERLESRLAKVEAEVKKPFSLKIER